MTRNERIKSAAFRAFGMPLKGTINAAYFFKAGADYADERAVQAVIDLFLALREIKGNPTLKDLIKLAKRIKS